MAAEAQAQAVGLLEAVENEIKKRKNPFTNKALTVVNQGTQIVLPGEPRQMTIEEGIECLQRKLKEESTPVQVYEEVQGYPLDGAFGWSFCFHESPSTQVRVGAASAHAWILRS